MFIPGVNKVFAADPCLVEQNMFDKNLLSDIIGIPLTTKDFVTSVATSAYSTVSGYGVTETVGCSSYIFDKLEIEADSDFAQCGGTADQTCQEITNTLPGPTGSNWLDKYYANRSSGTLLGLAYMAEDFTHREPLPANLAFYVNDTISRIPIINKTYAATDGYGHALLNSILNAWKVFRNLAYAAMALILLYTGIIIILRRKISSQLVVSVQYALPRIVIAIILITFSYPIGATLGSLGWTLFKSNWAIAGSIFVDTLKDTEAAKFVDAGSLKMWALLIPLQVLVGNAPLFLLFILLIIIIYLIAGLIYNFKAIILYLKIVFSILTAPIEFALAAVPGNDDKFKAWFMRMFKYVITLFGMGIIVPLGTIIAILVVEGYATETSGGAGALFAMVVPVFIILYCFGIGIGMEKRVEEFLGTGQKKR
ncbi:MAG: hypothetical protein UU64_C0004G0049 [candidate division WWE3 bacterium GW2011_GWF2_41_45]|nr:MAG: hypothetical protein UU55_C0007G0035 [candidate division WWE3 bacterium GW2011_GWC2_41_23]KKS10452.1 MAG: hypothetical protein UU64_C0004G0049 [candidate division WWE3 bacterium GW2011_GWF2_41_45]KKS19764.1 MAG: hypothetical protein UU79_C0010G0009 [candidate division WWE3 bacterium GW2011_GWE1_41_72]KKS29946.1 MAG: hypothetical protein UU90_C0006G0011 [candidate division WWE3 bacterium GW2011_GWD2_42_11]KKS50713.1 MAG: hypothetical protein UV16_C0007G0081 [candidate division WWE3 bacte